MSKTPKQMAEEYAFRVFGGGYEEMDQDKKGRWGDAYYAFLAGFEDGREMSNKEIFDEYIRLREKNKPTVVERIKVKVMGIF